MRSKINDITLIVLIWIIFDFLIYLFNAKYVKVAIGWDSQIILTILYIMNEGKIANPQYYSIGYLLQTSDNAPFILYAILFKVIGIDDPVKIADFLSSSNIFVLFLLSLNITIYNKIVKDNNIIKKLSLITIVIIPTYLSITGYFSTFNWAYVAYGFILLNFYIVFKYFSKNTVNKLRFGDAFILLLISFTLFNWYHTASVIFLIMFIVIFLLNVVNINKNINIFLIKSNWTSLTLMIVSLFFLSNYIDQSPLNTILQSITNIETFSLVSPFNAKYAGNAYNYSSPFPLNYFSIAQYLLYGLLILPLITKWFKNRKDPVNSFMLKFLLSFTLIIIFYILAFGIYGFSSLAFFTWIGSFAIIGSIRNMKKYNLKVFYLINIIRVAIILLLIMNIPFHNWITVQEYNSNIFMGKYSYDNMAIYSDFRLGPTMNLFHKFIYFPSNTYLPINLYIPLISNLFYNSTISAGYMSVNLIVQSLSYYKYNNENYILYLSESMQYYNIQSNTYSLRPAGKNFLSKFYNITTLDLIYNNNYTYIFVNT
jgi:hypothetical protein